MLRAWSISGVTLDAWQQVDEDGGRDHEDKKDGPGGDSPARRFAVALIESLEDVQNPRPRDDSDGEDDYQLSHRNVRNGNSRDEIRDHCNARVMEQTFRKRLCYDRPMYGALQNAQGEKGKWRWKRSGWCSRQTAPSRRSSSLRPISLQFAQCYERYMTSGGISSTIELQKRPLFRCQGQLAL